MHPLSPASSPQAQNGAKSGSLRPSERTGTQANANATRQEQRKPNDSPGGASNAGDSRADGRLPPAAQARAGAPDSREGVHGSGAGDEDHEGRERPTGEQRCEKAEQEQEAVSGSGVTWAVALGVRDV